MAKLILHAQGTTKDYALSGELTVGRQESNTIQIMEPKASRKHFRVYLEGSQYVVEDLKSSNGTKVNGHKVEKAPLHHGDSIQIGETRLVFDAPDVKAAGKETPGAKGARPAEATEDPLLGRRLDGYQLASRLGQGGMGAVYKALQVSMDRVVAVKVLKKELAEDRDFAKEFLEEARLAGKFKHPALVEIHDVGETSGTLWYAMELVKGESVMAKLRRQGRLEAGQALDIAISVCEVLKELEKEEAVHQDIKPHNILVDDDGQVKLTDFGLATIGGRIRRTARDPDSLVGSPHYMAPEQAARGRKVTVRTDLYGLGCTLYHMLTGKVPFDGPSALVILTKHANQTRPDPRAVNEKIPESLSELLRHMMAIEPAERPENARDVLAELKRVKTEWAKQAAAEGREARGVSARRLKSPDGPKREEADDETRKQEKVLGLDPGAARLVKVGVLVVLLVASFQVAQIVVAKLDAAPAVRRQSPRPPPPPPPPDTNKAVTNPDVDKKGETEKAGTPTGQPEEDPEAAAQLQEALKRRDMHLASGSFTEALRVLQQYRLAHPGGEAEKKVAAAYEETKRDIEAACQQLFQEGEQAAEEKNYRVTAAKCTRLISADPRSSWADKARALMGKVDLTTQARFGEANAAADRALEAGKLEDAKAALGGGLDALGGTKWAEPLTSRQTALLLVGKFLQDLERARAAGAAQGKPVNMLLPDLSGKPAPGVLRSINGLSFKADLRGVTLAYSLTKLRVEEIEQLVAALGQGGQHLGLAFLFTVLKQADAAKKEMDAALKIPEQAAQASLLQLRAEGVTNQHLYDFSKWQHQGDWDAPSGAWSTKDAQYVLESPEGGDTFLKTDAIGGPFPARQARISFEFAPLKRNENWYISAEFGDERRNITLLFTMTGYEVQIAADETQKGRGAWTAETTRVDLAVEGDKLSLSLNGKACEPLEAKGLGNLKGTLSFHVREATCAFDNILLRTMQ